MTTAVTLLTSLPGMGLDTMTKELENELKMSGKKVVFVYPHESTATNFRQIESMLLTKLKLDNQIDEFVSSIKEIKKFHIVLNKLQHFRDPILYLDYVDSLLRYSDLKVTLLITADVAFAAKIESHRLVLKGRVVTFRGYVDDGLKMIDVLARQMGVETSVQQKLQILSLVGGHLGLMKSLLLIIKSGQEIGDLKVLLGDSQVSARLSNIFDSLQQTYGKVETVMENETRLQSLGLANNGQTGELYLEYWKSSCEDVDITISLTPTEKKIYRLLESREGKFCQIDEIINLLFANRSEEITNWSIYKHLNNLGRKMKPQGILVEGHRGRGYLLKRR